MFENLFWVAVGLVVGVVYHAKLQPYVARAWSWLKDRIGTRKDAP